MSTRTMKIHGNPLSCGGARRKGASYCAIHDAAVGRARRGSSMAASSRFNGRWA
jgi:hypothetical protein